MATVPTPNLPKKPNNTMTTTTGNTAKTIPTANLPTNPTVTVKTSPAPPKTPATSSPSTTYGYENLDWRDKLSFFQTNPEAAKTELQRATNKANLQKATGDTAGYNKSMHWINQINTVMGTPSDPKVQQHNEFQTKINDMMKQFETMINTPFTYNFQTDPNFLAYKQLTDAEARDASMDALETLNARGILSSSITRDDIAGIEQAYAQKALAQVPIFAQQAYNQYQDRIRNAGEMLRLAMDQGNRLSDEIYQRERDQVADEQFDREFGLREKEFDLRNTETMATLTGLMPDGTPTNAKQQQDLQNAWYAIEQIGYVTPELAPIVGIPAGTRTQDAIDAAFRRNIDKMNAQTSQQNASTSRLNTLIEIWRSSGVAPAGIPGVKPGTPYYDPVAAREANQTGKTVDGMSYVQELNARFLGTDMNGQPVITDEKGLRKAILALGLPDSETDKLFSYYGLPINQ